MRSRSNARFVALFRKELLCESRSPHGLWTSGLFGLTAVMSFYFASYTTLPGPSLAAGILVVVLAFASLLSVPRTFLVEQEQGTFDLILLLGKPEEIFLAKMAFSFLQNLIAGVILSIIYLTLLQIPIQTPWIVFVTIPLLCLALSSAASLCGALVMSATNRWVLAAAVALPLILPLVFLGEGALRVAFGEGLLPGALMSMIALAGFGVAMAAASPLLVAVVWSNARSAPKD